MASETSSSSRLSAVERKHLGAFYTPAAMTNFIADWAIKSANDFILDPGCGDSAFLISAARRLRELGCTKPAFQRQLYGIDLNAQAIAQSAADLTSAGVSAQLHESNFFEVESSLFGPTLPRFDAVIGNPPYVRYQLFKDADRAAGLRAAARSGVILPQLTSSWAPYIVHAAGFLRDGGRFAMVLPGELLHVGYAAAVRTFLLRTFCNLTVIAFDEKVFPGALEEVVLVLGIKGESDGVLRVRSLKDLDQLKKPESVLRRARRCAVEPGRRWVTTLIEQNAVEAAQGVIQKADFQQLGSIARVDIGVVTGANDYFMVTKKQVVERRLPVTVLLPAVSRASHIKGVRFTFEDWMSQVNDGHPSYLLLVDELTVANPHVKQYIEEGVQLGLPARYKCRTRDPWYRVPYVRRPDLFLSYMSHFAPRLVVNEAAATNTNTVHGVFLSDPLLAEPLAAAFLNSATLLSVEIEGRSYGGGVLKLEPGEAVKIWVPRFTPAMITSLTQNLAAIDSMVRDGRIDEASAFVDRIVLGRPVKKAELENIRGVLSALRSRRFDRGRSAER